MTQTTDSYNSNQAGGSVGSARLGLNHGYSIDGDVALLHAEVEVPNDGVARDARWALQLWACEAPHAGGPLFGVKVAEATLSGVTAPAAQPLRLDTEALARVPGGQRDYSMVLVLASGENGSFDQVHDFANYPERQRFITPHLEGSVGYRVEGREAVLRADRIYNPRPSDNLSGSLRLELWALESEYRGGPFAGYELASCDLGRLAGDRCFDSLEQRVAFQPPAYGEWQVVLMLREWAGDARYVTRDYCNFAARYLVAEPTPVAQVEAQEPEAAPATPLAAVKHDASVTNPAAAKPAVAPATPVAAAKPEAAAKSVAAAKPAAAPAKPVAAAKPGAASPATTPTAPELKAKDRLNLPAEPASSPRELRAKPLTAAASEAANAVPSAIVAAASNAASALSTQPAKDACVSIMRASVEELAVVKGLNRKLAAEIIKHRPYKSVDDLVKVRGIGPKMLISLRAVLSL